MRDKFTIVCLVFMLVVASVGVIAGIALACGSSRCNVNPTPTPIFHTQSYTCTVIGQYFKPPNVWDDNPYQQWFSATCFNPTPSFNLSCYQESRHVDGVQWVGNGQNITIIKTWYDNDTQYAFYSSGCKAV